MPLHISAGLLRNLAKIGPPVACRGIRHLDLPHQFIAHQLQEIVFIRDMPIERHRPHHKFGGNAPHRHRLEPLGIGNGNRSAHDLTPIQPRLRTPGGALRFNLSHIRHIPEKLSDVTVQLILFVILFGYVFGGAIGIPGGNYREFLMAGMFAMTLFGAINSTAIGMSDDMSKELIGRTISDLLEACLGVTILTLIGLAVGWRAYEGSRHTAAAFALALLFGFAMSCARMFIGLTVRSPESAQSIGFIIVFPMRVPLEQLRPNRQHASGSARDRELESNQRSLGLATRSVRQSRSADGCISLALATCRRNLDCLVAHLYRRLPATRSPKVSPRNVPLTFQSTKPVSKCSRWASSTTKRQHAKDALVTFLRNLTTT